MTEKQQFAREQTLLATILDSAVDYAIITLGADNAITSWNAGAEKILGWTAEEILGQSGELIFVPEDRASGAPEREMAKALSKGRAEDVRWHARKDGSRFWANGLLMPLKGAPGFLKIMRDETHRRRTEQALSSSEDRFRTLAEHIPQLVFRAQPGGKRIWVSPQWVAFTGLSASDSLGLGWMEAVHPADQEPTLEAWSSADGTGELYVEHRLRRGDGHYRWFQTRAKRLADEQEWFGTSTDVDDLRRLKERQDVLLKELHHRTGNLLAVVGSIARRTAQSCSSIQDFSRRFENRIQALSRVQQQITRENVAAVELRDLVKMELDALGIMESGRVSIEGPSCRLTPRQAEAIALALHELATNAIKYGALANSGGHISVRWTCPQRGERLLEWRETGITTLGSEGVPRRGYGRELIETALPYALGAQTTLDFRSEGEVYCKISMPENEAFQA